MVKDEQARSEQGYYQIINSLQDFLPQAQCSTFVFTMSIVVTHVPHTLWAHPSLDLVHLTFSSTQESSLDCKMRKVVLLVNQQNLEEKNITSLPSFAGLLEIAGYLDALGTRVCCCCY
jgi:hypothetical protein